MKCNQSGRCCRLFMINLNEEEYKSDRYKTIFEEFGKIEDFAEAEQIGANFLAQNEDGSCIYLKDNLCSIHKDRPKVCRGFFCESKDPKYKEMIDMINEADKAKNEKLKSDNQNLNSSLVNIKL